MDTTGLDAAYRRLLTAAEAISDTRVLATDARSAVDWTLSHLALSDRILATAARDLLAGLPVVIDNRDAMDSTAIASLIASTTHARRIDLVRRNAADLVALITAIPEHTSAAPVRLHLVDRDGRQLPDQQLPWNGLIRLRATEHLPGHAARLTGLSAK
ncbi:hypothetical protein ACWCXX_20350 [Streptomyces sp. NPDC001732]